MLILGLPMLEEYKYNHADARGPLDAWRNEAEKADWKTTQDIKRLFPSTDILPSNRVIFNSKGNKYRLLVQVRYQSNLVVVVWIDTHAEYDKKRF
ncbi:MAG: type II toxin-antitoxin system HigB family toxin [Candidatus Nitrotoga sp.]